MLPVSTPRNWTLYPALLEGLKKVSSLEALTFISSKTAKLYIHLLAQELEIPIKIAYRVTYLRARPIWTQERENEIIKKGKEIGNGIHL